MSKRQRRRLQERRNLQRTRSRWIIGAKLPVTLAIATVGGHEILPIGGHWNSPLAAANSPRWRPRISPLVLS
jgi:hypothetical protein